MFADRVPASESRGAVEGRHTLRKFASRADANPDVLNVILFRGTSGTPCGWFIGPLVVAEGQATLSYLPQSEETRAAVAVVRAVEAGRTIGCSVCVIDPENLWEKVWTA